MSFLNKIFFGRDKEHFWGAAYVTNYYACRKMVFVGFFFFWGGIQVWGQNGTLAPVAIGEAPMCLTLTCTGPDV